METTISVIGSLIAAAGTVPYIIATAKRRTKPRLVTWFTWTLLTAVASAAAFSDGQFAAGFFPLTGTMTLSIVVIVGWRYGDRSFTALDVICLVSVLAGLLLWLLTRDPAIGVWMVIIIDFIGLIPTLHHAWKRPFEETMSTYVIVGIGGTIAVLPIVFSGNITVTSIGYPLYTTISLGLTAILISMRRRVVKPSKLSAKQS